MRATFKQKIEQGSTTIKSLPVLKRRIQSDIDTMKTIIKEQGGSVSPEDFACIIIFEYERYLEETRKTRKDLENMTPEERAEHRREVKRIWNARNRDRINAERREKYSQSESIKEHARVRQARHYAKRKELENE